MVKDLEFCIKCKKWTSNKLNNEFICLNCINTNKLLRLEKSPFGLDSYDIDYEIDGKLYIGVLISKEKIKQMENLYNEQQ